MGKKDLQNAMWINPQKNIFLSLKNGENGRVEKKDKCVVGLSALFLAPSHFLHIFLYTRTLTVCIYILMLAGAIIATQAYGPNGKKFQPNTNEREKKHI